MPSLPTLMPYEMTHRTILFKVTWHPTTSTDISGALYFRCVICSVTSAYELSGFALSYPAFPACSGGQYARFGNIGSNPINSIDCRIYGTRFRKIGFQMHEPDILSVTASFRWPER